MIVAVLMGFLVAIFTQYLQKRAPNHAGYVLALLPLGIFIYLTTFIAPVIDGQVMHLRYTWFPEMKIDISFLVDGLSLTFALIISGIGALIIFYAKGYLHQHPKQGRFYGYLLFFMASMLGVVLADNIITLFVFWELTSVSSYLLIGFNHESEKSRKAALQALLVTGGGGLALLAGMIAIGMVGDSFTFSELLSQSDYIKSHALYPAILVLVFLGAFTKSAQFPFHYWLPNAMQAPSPVSAYLHSATMVKAGVYLLARFTPLLGGTVQWQYTLLAVGAITMLLGAIRALGQTDLKRILAYTTISALGILVFLIGMGTNMAISAAITFLVVHAMYKGSLFLVAGAIDHETGTRDIRILSGLKKHLPIIAIAGLLSALSYAGFIPFLGFVGKELIYESVLHFPLVPLIITTMVVVVNMLLVATAIMTGIRPFFGSVVPTPKHPHSAPFTLWLPPLILGIGGLCWGILTVDFSRIFASTGASAILNQTINSDLHLWHGFTVSLALSVLTVIGGIGIYYIRHVGLKFDNMITRNKLLQMESTYDWGLKNMLGFAGWQTNFFQNGYMRHYILWTVLAFLFLGSLALVLYVDLSAISLNTKGIFTYEVLIVVVVMLAALFAIRSKSVLGAIASLGVTGYGIAIFFVFYGAPDLALTQFSIETLTVILLVLVVYKIPRFANYSKTTPKVRDAIISIGVGSFITVMLLVLLSTEPPPSIKEYFLENTYLLAHGRNVVNVILVDFRAFDTLGEITVLAIAAVGVITLLKLRVDRKKKQSDEKLQPPLSGSTD
ncbi:MAG: putative monovalent cation/H+ antiporter subunit A [Bacteroidales bacterium]|nr:putative monovalent cation/H+ antiporter subunit A [Bacteroidales bacterium]